MTAAYRAATVVFIGEAQWFNDLDATARDMVTLDNKHVVVSGLSGDYDMKPYQSITYLLSFAETLTMLNARCYYCGEGHAFGASFTMRKFSADERNVVGGKRLYLPVCRMHHRLPKS